MPDTPIMRAQFRDPITIEIGGTVADRDTLMSQYKLDGDALFEQLNKSLPAGTFARLVTQYLRQFRKRDAADMARYDSVGHIDHCIVNTIALIGERHCDDPNRFLSEVDHGAELARTDT